MDPKLNFLFALLAAVVLVSLAMSLRSCGKKPPIPEYFDRQVTIERAIDQANREEGVVFAFFTADWCPVCARFKDGPLSSAPVRDWVYSYAVPVYLDVSRARSGDIDQQVLLTRFRVDALPTVLILQNGQEIGRQTGNVPRRDLMKWLRSFSDPPAP